MEETCTNPSKIREGDLVAYVDGLASREVVAHVRRCAACTRRAEEMSSLQALLAARLYRHSCPTSEQLIAFHQAELQGSEKLLVAQHLRQCPHCARELATLASSERQSLAERLGSALTVLTAVRLAPAAQTAPVRAGAGRVRGRPQVYQAGSIEVILDLRPTAPGLPQHDLSGVIHIGGQVPDKIGGAGVEMYRGDELIALAEVSARGHFAVPGVQPDEYDLALLWGEQEIWLRGIRVP